MSTVKTMHIQPPAKILVSGAAGFIGFHVCQELLDRGFHVIGIDNLNQYYSVDLKWARLQRLESLPNWTFLHGDICNPVDIERLVIAEPDAIVHLAAQAGVRYSMENPSSFLQNNVLGSGNVLELAKRLKVRQFVYASSSSVYGANETLPFRETDTTDRQISVYGVTKKTLESLAHSYSHLDGIPTIGLRYFTVYGPWGRPDMALFDFTRRILAGERIRLFNGGEMRRDFTYIDDVVTATVGMLISEPVAQARIFNVAYGSSVPLNRFVEILEESLQLKAQIDFDALQPGDLVDTFADTSSIKVAIEYHPQTPIEEGIPKFVDWYRSYHL